MRDYVINLYFDVVRERCEEDYASNQPVKDRYRILTGDDGLERNFLGNQHLSQVRAMGDILRSALFLLAQCGLVAQNPKGQSAFKLTAAGRKGALFSPLDRAASDS